MKTTVSLRNSHSILRGKTASVDILFVQLNQAVVGRRHGRNEAVHGTAETWASGCPSRDLSKSVKTEIKGSWILLIDVPNYLPARNPVNELTMKRHESCESDSEKEKASYKTVDTWFVSSQKWPMSSLPVHLETASHPCNQIFLLEFDSSPFALSLLNLNSYFSQWWITRLLCIIWMLPLINEIFLFR